MSGAKCRPCGKTRRPKQYLCPSCWFQLSPAAREALNLRDVLALRRLASLHEQLRKGVLLAEVDMDGAGQ